MSKPRNQRQRMVLTALTAVLLAGGAASGQLVGFYEFEGDGTDSSGMGNHAVVIGNPFSADGNGLGGGYAFENDGVTAQYMTAHLQISPAVAPQVSIGCWVNINDTGYQTFLQNDGHFGRKLGIDMREYDGSEVDWNYAGHGGRSIGVAEDDWHMGNTFPDENEYGYRAVVEGGLADASDGWVFVAAVYDARRGEATIYTDNTAYKHVDTYPFNPTDDSRYGDELHIGAIKNTWEKLNGRMDNAFVFNGALTPAQVASIRGAADPLAAAQAVSAEITASKNRTWKIDFNPKFPSYFNVIPQGVGGEETWNSLETGAERLGESGGWPVTYDPSISDIADTDNTPTTSADPDFTIFGQPGNYSYGAVADPAAGDYMVWGGPAGTASNLTWQFSDLDPDKAYRIIPVGGGVYDNYKNNNERRRFAMLVDTDGDGQYDTSRLIKMCRGGAIGFVATPSAAGTIIGAVGHGGDWANEANWGSVILEELGEKRDGKFALRSQPAHRYSFDGAGSEITDSIGGANGYTLGADGAPTTGLIGGGVMYTSPDDGYGALPSGLLDGYNSVTVEVWFSFEGDGSVENQKLWSFGDGGGEVFEQNATGDPFTPYTNDPEWFHNVILRTDEASPDVNVFIGDNGWGTGDRQHVVVSLDHGAGAEGTNIVSYYLNGMLVKQALTEAQLSDIDFVNMYLGANQAGNRLTPGFYEEVRIYDYALSEDEVIGNLLNGPDVVNAATADTNGDGVVDAADYITVKKNLGTATGAGAAAGDLNRDGVVDWADLGIVIEGINAGSTGSAVTPEPASLGLLAIGAVALLRRRNRV